MALSTRGTNGFLIWLVALDLAGAGLSFGAVSPNARINTGVPVQGSPASGLGNLTDGRFGNGSWNISSGSWVAYKLPSAVGKVVLAWNNPSYTWSDYVTNASRCAQGSNLSFPSDYEIQSSSNSTNGSDGAWTSRMKIAGNKVSSRSHVVDLGTDTWIRMRITGGNGGLDELGVYDASSGADDTWVFIGTSISSNAFKGTPPSTDFVKLVSDGTKGANAPVVVKAGIPCISSTDVSNNIGRYLDFAGSSRFWAIEMGTNDAWGGGTGNVQTFKGALQKVIDSAKGRGIRVLIARPLATNAAKAGWQMNQAFLTAVDDLTKTNALAAGPDLYSWFLAHPSELNDDGVHPNAAGAASIQKLWAEAMLKTVYSGSTSVEYAEKRYSGADMSGIRVMRSKTGFRIVAEGVAGPMRLISVDGTVREIGRDGSGFVPMEWGLTGIQIMQVGRAVMPILLAR